ncbi:MAG: hypothetical protein DBY17_06645 [Oscillospiraceae bacterium]|nr:MAG: hypothetical protein DBY17_06645 [Oscillospiraceae bacterium]
MAARLKAEKRRPQNTGGAFLHKACCFYLILKMARSSPESSFGLFHTMICTALPPSMCPFAGPYLPVHGKTAFPRTGLTVSYTAAGKNVTHRRRRKQ